MSNEDIKKLEELVRQNDTKAMLELGEIYENGNGVKQDYQKAKELYEQADRDGNSLAKYFLDNLNEKIKKLSEKDKIINFDKIEQFKSLVKEIDGKYVAREKTIRLLSNNIYHGRNVIKAIDDKQTIRSIISTILLISSTGGGKTAIVSDLAKKFDVPFISVSLSAGYTQAGYVGLDLQDIFRDLINAADGSIKKAEEGIILLDEFDKIRINENEKDSHFKKALQHELLSYLEGRKIQINTRICPISFDTSKVTFILSGAFQDIIENCIDYSDEQLKELITSGYESELLGRIGIYHYMPKYTKEDYINILNNSTMSPLKNFIISCSIYGKNVITSPYSPFIESVAEAAVNLDKGVRGLNNIFTNILSWHLNDLIYGKSDISLLESYEEIKRKKCKNKGRQL